MYYDYEKTDLNYYGINYTLSCGITSDIFSTLNTKKAIIYDSHKSHKLLADITKKKVVQVNLNDFEHIYLLVCNTDMKKSVMFYNIHFRELKNLLNCGTFSLYVINNKKLANDKYLTCAMLGDTFVPLTLFINNSKKIVTKYDFYELHVFYDYDNNSKVLMSKIKDTNKNNIIYTYNSESIIGILGCSDDQCEFR